MTAAPLPALPVSRIVVWRHGRTAWNVEGRFQGQQDPPLEQAGRAAAAVAARHLLADGLLIDGAVVVSSDLVRALDTATALTDLLGTAPRVDARLREQGLGAWEGLTRAEVAERYPGQYADWQAGHPVRDRGGEETADIAARAVAALADLPRAGTAVVVTHAATGGRLIEALLGLDPGHGRVVGPLANCAWSVLGSHGGRWRLLRHNVAAPAGANAAAEGPPLPTDDAAAAG